MLRLLAQSADDLPVISALVQDAAVRREDIHYDAKARRFVMLVQRYRWEADQTKTRVRSALRIEHVLRVQVRDLKSEAVFSLLSVTADKLSADADDPAVMMHLVFSGPHGLRLEVENLNLVLEDMTDSWQASAVPKHTI